MILIRYNAQMAFMSRSRDMSTTRDENTCFSIKIFMYESMSTLQTWYDKIFMKAYMFGLVTSYQLLQKSTKETSILKFLHMYFLLNKNCLLSVFVPKVSYNLKKTPLFENNSVKNLHNNAINKYLPWHSFKVSFHVLHFLVFVFVLDL